MLSKRDLQLVRLAVRWKWITPENGEDILFLKRKFGEKLTLEEIIRRRGYIDDAELDQLVREANQLVGRRARPAAKARRASADRPGSTAPRVEAVAAEAAPAARPAPRVGPSSAPDAPGAPGGRATAGPAARGRTSAPEGGARSARPAIEARSREPSPGLSPGGAAGWPGGPGPREAPSTRIAPFPGGDDAGSAGEGADPSARSPRRRVAIDRSATVVMPLPHFVREPEGRRVEVEELHPPVVDEDDFSATIPATIVTEIPEAVREALARRQHPPADRTQISDPAELERLRDEASRFGVPEVSVVPVDAPPPRGEIVVRGAREARPPTIVPTPGQRAPSLRPRSMISGRPIISREELAPPPEARGAEPSPSPSPGGPSAWREGPGPREVAPLEPLPPTQAEPALFDADEDQADDPATVAPVLDGEDGELEEEQLEALGPYLIDRVIARGKRGVLYRATNEAGVKVALKVLAPEVIRRPRFLARLGEAASKAVQLASPHVVRLLDAGEVEGRAFIAMEYVDAWTLEERLDSGDRPGLLESLRILRDVARGLDAAHALGIVHQDVNPDNVLIGRDGEVRLTGFALPKELSSGAVPLSSRDAPLHGTAGYAAPEQVLGGPVDHRADLYALGATLFHLLTGRRIFEGNDTAAILAQVSRQPAPKTRVVDPNVPELAANVVDRLLAPEREARFASAKEVVAALDLAILRLGVSEAAGAREAEQAGRRVMVARVSLYSGAILLAAIGLPTLMVELELAPWTTARFALHDALAGALAVIGALVLLGGLALVRRGELPLPMSSAWLVRVQDGLGAFGAALLAGGIAIGPGAVLNVVVSLAGGLVVASWVYGILLRTAIAGARPDKGVGRMLAVLGDPGLARWRLVHVPLVATLAALATARWAFLAYFAGSAGL